MLSKDSVSLTGDQSLTRPGAPSEPPGTSVDMISGTDITSSLLHFIQMEDMRNEKRGTGRVNIPDGNKMIVQKIPQN